METSKPLDTYILVSVGACIVALAVGSLYVSLSVRNDIEQLQYAVSETGGYLASMSASTTAERALVEERFVQLSDALYAEQKRVDELMESFEDFEGDVDKLSGSVKTLEKLSTTDAQLLQKYSQIYFLNEHYIPADLEAIPEKYDFANGKEVTVHAEMLPFLEDMLDSAQEDGVDLMVLSGYRSFAEQTTLKQTYATRYGTGANAFSADQGYSEHQLGTTVDFTNKTAGENLSGFEGTSAHAWLVKNAYKYGFVMSYPENNDHYVYEPWHWRFVGKDLARYLYRNNKGLYDLEQRKIDEYLAELFD